MAGPVSWLYVPGDRPDRFAKAAASGAHVVILDLEDAVAPAHKEAARREAVAWLPDAAAGTVEVRVNALGTRWAADDLAALAGWAALRAVRIPKVQRGADVHAAIDQLADPDVPLNCVLETALGVENAFAVATAHDRVHAIGLGEADLAGDLGVGDAGLVWSRARVVSASRAAGLGAPAQSVFTNVTDLDGLRQSCLSGRELGFVGRSAIHPRQIPVIHDAYRPSDDELAAAQAVLAGLAEAEQIDAGVAVLADGRMVDAAMRKRALDLVELAAVLPPRG